VSFRLVFNNPTLPENTGDHRSSYTTSWDTISSGFFLRSFSTLKLAVSIGCVAHRLVTFQPRPKRARDRSYVSGG